MNIQVGTYTAVVVDGLLRLLQSEERHIGVVNVAPQGTTISTLAYSSISPAMAASPVLMATWAGDGYADVDLDCGAQRWNGMKSLRWIRSGLYRAGFTKAQVDALLREMRSAGTRTCPRCR